MENVKFWKRVGVLDQLHRAVFRNMGTEELLPSTRVCVCVYTIQSDEGLQTVMLLTYEW